MGMLAILVLAGVALAVAASQSKGKTAAVPMSVALTPEQTQQIAAYTHLPPALVPAFAAAIHSGDANVAYATAAALRAQGYSTAADMLTQAADMALGKPPSASPAASPAVVPSDGGLMTAATLIPASMPASSITPAVPPFVAQDPPMGASLKAMVDGILQKTNDPATINRVADMLQANGYPNTAAELRRRAGQIASAQVDPISIIEDILHQADQGHVPAAPAPGAIPAVSVPTSVPQAQPVGTPQAAPAVIPQAAPAAQPETAPAPQAPPGMVIPLPTGLVVPQAPPGVIPFPTGIVLSQPPGGINLPGLVPAAVQEAVARFYVVESGDNPSKIATKFTGDANRWRDMAKVNPEANLSSGVIYPGQRLRIPAEWPNAPAAGPVIQRPPASATSALVPVAAYDDKVARDLGSQVLADVSSKGERYDVTLLKRFQIAAGLPPDGQYGPRTAGAVEYFASASAPPSLPKYGTGKKPYAPPRGIASQKPAPGANA